MALASADQVASYYQTYLGRAPETSEAIGNYTIMTPQDAENSIRNSPEAQDRLIEGRAPTTVQNTMSSQVNAPSLPAGTQVVPQLQGVQGDELQQTPYATGSGDITAAQAATSQATAPTAKPVSTYQASTVGTNTPTMTAATSGGQIPDSSKIAELYQAYLGRAPEPDGLRYWTDLAQQQGMNLQQMSSAIASSQEAQLALVNGFTPDPAKIQAITLGGANVTAAQGSLSAGAMAQAQSGTAAQVVATAPRTVQQGELVSGSTVDQSKVAQADGVAAQGSVDKQSTVQGQLEGLMNQFEGGNTPAWAAGAMRTAQQILAARGLSASSMAGQAIVQAAMEAATPIAAADAQTYAQMGLANLSARQQMALQNAQMRAQFLGQEFDQAFQTRVLNASKISEIANMNFTAEQTVALQNAQLTQQMNLQNLSNAQATSIANAAAIASMDMANLNNRQQAAVVNAQSFLQKSMQDLSFQQQAAQINQQSRLQTLLSDQAATNAAAQFNATSTNQVNQFYDNLAAQISQFNAGQSNAMAQYNAGEVNAINKFVAEQKEAREQFNIKNQLAVDQSNVAWRRTLNTQNTAAINAANQVNAQNLLNISNTALNNLWQQYRDEASWAFTAGENQANRNYNLAAAAMERDFLTSQMDENQKNALMQQLGAFGANLVGRAFGV